MSSKQLREIKYNLESLTLRIQYFVFGVYLGAHCSLDKYFEIQKQQDKFKRFTRET